MVAMVERTSMIKFLFPVVTFTNRIKSIGYSFGQRKIRVGTDGGGSP